MFFGSQTMRYFIIFLGSALWATSRAVDISSPHVESVPGDPNTGNSKNERIVIFSKTQKRSGKLQTSADLKFHGDSQVNVRRRRSIWENHLLNLIAAEMQKFHKDTLKSEINNYLPTIVSTLRDKLRLPQIMSSLTERLKTYIEHVFDEFRISFSPYQLEYNGITNNNVDRHFNKKFKSILSTPKRSSNVMLNTLTSSGGNNHMEAIWKAVTTIEKYNSDAVGLEKTLLETILGNTAKSYNGRPASSIFKTLAVDSKSDVASRLMADLFANLKPDSAVAILGMLDKITKIRQKINKIDRKLKNCLTDVDKKDLNVISTKLEPIRILTNGWLNAWLKFSDSMGEKM